MKSHGIYYNQWKDWHVIGKNCCWSLVRTVVKEGHQKGCVGGDWVNTMFWIHVLTLVRFSAVSLTWTGLVGMAVAPPCSSPAGNAVLRRYLYAAMSRHTHTYLYGCSRIGWVIIFACRGKKGYFNMAVCDKNLNNLSGIFIRVKCYVVFYFSSINFIWLSYKLI